MYFSFSFENPLKKLCIATVLNPFEIKEVKHVTLQPINSHPHPFQRAYPCLITPFKLEQAQRSHPNSVSRLVQDISPNGNLLRTVATRFAKEET